MKSVPSFLIAGLLTFGVITLDARPVNYMPYQEASDRSDAIVIATPVASSDTGEHIDLPGIDVLHGDKTHTGLPVVGVETKFRVALVLKGGPALKELTLHHYREAARSPSPTMNAVTLVTFDISKQESFLLFLKLEKDGRFAPVDQTDPGLLCVQKVRADIQNFTPPATAGH